jgi:putative flavoprotein involved in K+ transport
MTHSIHTLIIGGGQAGLAMSRCLGDRGVDHVVLERGRIGERWRSERWDSLKLLTPRWQSRLPGWEYHGQNPDGYMGRDELVRYLTAYARWSGAPVETGVTVLAVRPHPAGGLRVATDQGDWHARNVVLATGACARANVPGLAGGLATDLHQVTPDRYKNPSQLPDGGVLVVGASATGAQLAAELQASGRQVTLAVGKHIRLPRSYRGLDIMRWLDGLGVLDETTASLPHAAAAKAQPSLQLVGRDDHRDLDLGILQAQGVRLVGRAVAARGAQVSFADDLAATIDHAEGKLRRTLDRIDAGIDRLGLDAADAAPLAPVQAPAAPTQLDLRAEGIRTVLWATGFRPHMPWLRVPAAKDARGALLHTGGITPYPGLYALGLKLMRRRKSTFIDGVGADAQDLAAHLVARSPTRRLVA